MSLCDAKNRTTSPFSFLIGTMSSKHQNGRPAAAAAAAAAAAVILKKSRMHL
jgi:hypothetical protein